MKSKTTNLSLISARQGFLKNTRWEVSEEKHQLTLSRQQGVIQYVCFIDAVEKKNLKRKSWILVTKSLNYFFLLKPIYN